MLMAIDESGSFSASFFNRCFFTAIHLRQRKTLYKDKKSQFVDWEKSLPKRLKNPKGEIKSSSLSDDQLLDFAKRILCVPPFVGITTYSVRPQKNPESVIKKHCQVVLMGIREGEKEYANMGKPKMAKTYHEFGNWLNKLNYSQFLKIQMLGRCMYGALINTIGHSVTGKYDRDELMRMKYLIDRDFIREPRPNAFWHELLRNQLYQTSKNDPLPFPELWERRGHPFVKKYTKGNHFVLTELFRDNCDFVHSHEYFEVRIADTVNTIISRWFNKKQCRNAYAKVRHCFLHHGRVTELICNDFDIDSWHYDPEENPWKKFPLNPEVGQVD